MKKKEGYVQIKKNKIDAKRLNRSNCKSTVWDFIAANIILLTLHDHSETSDLLGVTLEHNMCR